MHKQAGAHREEAGITISIQRILTGLTEFSLINYHTSHSETSENERS